MSGLRDNRRAPNKEERQEIAGKKVLYGVFLYLLYILGSVYGDSNPNTPKGMIGMDNQVLDQWITGIVMAPIAIWLLGNIAFYWWGGLGKEDVNDVL